METSSSSSSKYKTELLKERAVLAVECRDFEGGGGEFDVIQGKHSTRHKRNNRSRQI
jgi:hypothetical protein